MGAPRAASVRRRFVQRLGRHQGSDAVGRHGCGYADLAHAHTGDQYRFLLSTPDRELVRIDPYAREVTSSTRNAIVHDPTFDWQGDDFHLASWNALVIYELHVGTFNDQNDATGVATTTTSRTIRARTSSRSRVPAMAGPGMPRYPSARTAR